MQSLLDNQSAVGLLAPVTQHVVYRLIERYRRLPSCRCLYLGAVGPDDRFIGRSNKLRIDLRDDVASRRALQHAREYDAHRIGGRTAEIVDLTALAAFEQEDHATIEVAHIDNSP